MARIIVLENEKIRAEIAPDNGGMVTSLKIEGVEVLRLDKEKLDVIPMLAGGVPVLFPFASKTKDDRYYVDGTEYGMPFHGLVKNSAFGTKHVGKDKVTLFTTSSDAWTGSQYPFPFALELNYSLTEDGLEFRASIYNNGRKALPHAFGWHPYFRASDKKAVKLDYSYATNYDYVNHADAGPAPTDMDLSKPWDHVFHTPSERSFTLENPVDGYRARVETSDNMPVLVVCTTLDGAVCAEPWCGLPNSANSGRFLQTVPPEESRDCVMTIRLTTI